MKNQRVADRVGSRYIYQRLSESGKFNRPDMTPAESVRAALVDDALSELSLENAMSV